MSLPALSAAFCTPALTLDSGLGRSVLPAALEPVLVSALGPALTPEDPREAEPAVLDSLLDSLLDVLAEPLSVSACAVP